MKILLVGGGGREHALAWKLAQSPLGPELLAAPGNPGIAGLGRCFPVKADDAAALEALAAAQAVDLVVVGPEAALAAGLADRLAARGIACFGPTAAAGEVETSKAFTKAFCRRWDIPTADFQVFDDAPTAKASLAAREAPFVIKADGLAAGKGVVIAQTRAEADAAIDQILFWRKFGAAGQRIVIEDFLPGEEASFFALCDGETAIPFGGAQDHKRAFDGDKGPNTGGMGAYAPAPILDAATEARVMAELILPAVKGLAAEGRPFKGVLFAGLMIGPQGPRLIEFNARFGDPECQALMLRLESDLLPLLAAAARGALASTPPPVWRAGASAVVVMAAQGYPDEPLTGSVIRGIPAANALPDATVFQAGTRLDDEGLLRAAGGRVLNACAYGATLPAAVERAYEAVAAIDWPGGFYRRDIAWRALRRAPQ
jgi:phosphoribosylamine--glycine ligase